MEPISRLAGSATVTDHRRFMAWKIGKKKQAKRPALMSLDRRADQRLENWKLRRAFARPYFFRSTTRESRVRNPPFFRTPRNSGS